MSRFRSNNPVLWREWRGRWRRPLTPIVVFAYAALLALAVWWAYSGQSEAQTQTGLHGMGHSMLRALACWQLVLVTLLATTLSAPSVVAEKEQGMWTMLRLSPLSPLQIVSGKLGSALAFIILLIFVPLPMSATLLFLGGVSGTEFVLVVLVQLVTAFASGALALAISSSSRTTEAALGWSLPSAAALAIMPLCALWTLGGPAFHGFAIFCIVAGAVFAYLMTFAWTPALVANSGMDIERSFQIGASDTLFSFAPTHTGLYGSHPPPAHTHGAPAQTAPGHAAPAQTAPTQTLSAPSASRPISSPMDFSDAPPALWGSLQQAFPDAPPAIKESLHQAFPETARRLEIPPRTERSDGPIGERLRFQNPVLQRTVRGQLRYWCKLPQSEIWATAGLVLVAWFLLACIIASIFYVGDTPTFFGVWFFSAAGITFPAIKVASLAFARDRAQGMLKPLPMTLLTPLDIVWGKLAAALLASAFPGLICLPLILIPLVAMPLQTVIAVIFLVSFVFMSAACGLLCAWYCESAPLSLAGATIMVAGLVVIPIQLRAPQSPIGDWARAHKYWPQVQAWLYPVTPTDLLCSGAMAVAICIVIGLIALLPVVRALHPSALEKDGSNLLSQDLSKAF